MKKSILKIGKALNRLEQKEINGGYMAEMCSDNCKCTSEQKCEQKPCAGEDTWMCVAK